MHPVPNDHVSVLTLHKKVYSGSPLSWGRDTPNHGESGSEWKTRTEEHDFLMNVETITKIVYQVLLEEMTAKHMPLHVVQWGIWPARIALHCFPFDSERVCSLDDIVRTLYLIDGKQTVDRDQSCASESTGITLRWLRQNHEPTLWIIVPHPCMNGSLSNYAQRGLQRALNTDEKAEITEWEGSATQKHLETFLFHQACVEFVLALTLSDEQEKENRRQASHNALELLLTEIALQSPIFCLAENPIIRTRLAATTVAGEGGGGEENGNHQEGEGGGGVQEAGTDLRDGTCSHSGCFAAAPAQAERPPADLEGTTFRSTDGTGILAF
jgi:hypothetical protein